MFFDFVQIILKDKSLLFWLRMIFYKYKYEERYINIKDLLESNKSFKETDIKGIILIMQDIGAIRNIKEHGYKSWDTYEVDYNKFDALCYETLSVIKYLEEEKKRGCALSYKLVAKLPNCTKISDQYIAIKKNTELLYDAILDLITSAHKEIIILNPFFDKNGVELLSAEVYKKLSQGVSIHIITRYSGDKNINNRKSLNKMIEYMRSISNYKKILRIYDYNYENEIYKSKTFHAKAIIVDEGIKAYIGSANLTGWGLDEQLELGTLIEDKNAQVLYNIIEYLSSEGILKEILF